MAPLLTCTIEFCHAACAAAELLVVRAASMPSVSLNVFLRGTYSSAFFSVCQLCFQLKCWTLLTKALY